VTLQRGHILVVDDEPNIRKLLAGVLEDEGYTVVSAADSDAARALLATEQIDLLLLDVQLPRQDGIDFLRELQAKAETRSEAEAAAPPVIMMSGHGTIATAVEATRLGALDFIEKPIQVERLLLSMANALRIQQLRSENADLRRSLGATDRLIGSSPVMQNLRAEIERAGPTDARVLITGENGTGKELIARALHAVSPRRDRPLVTVNCAAIPADLLESELFGHERGAFTGAVARRRGKFERANGGTLLLDEIGDLNPTTQAKLLRVLEEGEVERVGGETTVALDLRVLAATNRDLNRLRRDGSFREDLFHRLQVLPIHAPPLRDHAEDVPELAEHFLRHFCTTGGRPPRQLSAAALAALRAHRWPGNVRELRNLMERVVIMVDAVMIERSAIEPYLEPAARGGSGLESATGAGLDTPDTPDAPDSDASLADQLLAVERRLVAMALENCDGNIAAAARTLGLDRANLHRRLKRLGLRT